MSDAQAQPIRPGDVYPPSAADHHQARRERDKAVAADQGGGGGDLRVTEADLPAAGKRVVTATAGGQVMAQFTVPVPSAEEETTDAVTIGEALQAAGSDDNEPVGLADAAAVQAAEMRTTGLAGVVPGGVAAAAQQAAEANMRRRPDGDDGENKATTTTLMKDVVGGAAEALPADMVATREDADRVAAAAARNAARRGGGGGKGVAEAAEMNEGRMV